MWVGGKVGGGQLGDSWLLAVSQHLMRQGTALQDDGLTGSGVGVGACTAASGAVGACTAASGPVGAIAGGQGAGQALGSAVAHPAVGPAVGPGAGPGAPPSIQSWWRWWGAGPGAPSSSRQPWWSGRGPGAPFSLPPWWSGRGPGAPSSPPKPQRLPLAPLQAGIRRDTEGGRGGGLACALPTAITRCACWCKRRGANSWSKRLAPVC
jgi:hypothetical protein